MNINVLVKQAGKRRALQQLSFEIPDEAITLKDLISLIVQKNVADFNAKKIDADIVGILTKQELDAQADTGKVGFGRRFAQKDADPEKACEVALQAFEDGLFRVFIDEEEACDLHENLNLHENSQVAFIRFTFLAGRMW